MPKVLPPYHIFYDVDGTPLEAGYIYIGAAGLNPEILANQLNVYWDIDLTIPAVQPLRTIGGYPSYAGSPRSIYIAETNHSIVTRDRNNILVASDLYATGDATNVQLAVLSLAELANVDTSRYTSVYLDSGSLSGVFIWDSSDLSTEVTADSQKGFFVPPTSDITGTSGAWKRTVKELNIDHFGGGQTGFFAACDLATVIGLPIVGGSVTVASSDSIPDNVEIQNMNLVLNSAVTHGTGVVFYNVEFSGTSVIQPNYSCDNADYLMCSFTGSCYINCIAGFSRGPRHLHIANCVTSSASLIYGTSVDYSVITCNKVNATGKAFGISFAGRSNKITNNESYGGTTGIICTPVRSANQTQRLSDNVISNNYVHGVSEEGISLDCRGDSNTDGLAVASTTIATAVTSSVTFTNIFPTAYQQLDQYVVFQTGDRKGEYYRIVYAGASGLGPYQLENYTAATADVGQTVTVQLGGFGNVIENNKVENAGTIGILVYGSWIGTTVQNNRTLNCDIQARTLSGITSSIALSYQPPHYTKLINNTAIGGDIKSNKTEFAATTAIEPTGLELTGNKVGNDGIVSIEVGENITESNNRNLSCTLDTVVSENGEYEVTLPGDITFTTGVAKLVHTINLPSNFAVSVDTQVTIGLAQCSGEIETKTIAYRSNEATSSYGSTDAAGTLNKAQNNPTNRNISSIVIASTVNSTTTLNDTATLDINVTVTLTGALSPSTAKGRVKIKYRVTN